MNQIKKKQWETDLSEFKQKRNNEKQTLLN